MSNNTRAQNVEIYEGPTILNPDNFTPFKRFVVAFDFHYEECHDLRSWTPTTNEDLAEAVAEQIKVALAKAWNDQQAMTKRVDVPFVEGQKINYADHPDVKPEDEPIPGKYRKMPYETTVHVIHTS